MRKKNAVHIILLNILNVHYVVFSLNNNAWSFHFCPRVYRPRSTKYKMDLNILHSRGTGWFHIVKRLKPDFPFFTLNPWDHIWVFTNQCPPGTGHTPYTRHSRYPGRLTGSSPVLYHSCFLDPGEQGSCPFCISTPPSLAYQR